MYRVSGLREPSLKKNGFGLTGNFRMNLRRSSTALSFIESALVLDVGASGEVSGYPNTLRIVKKKPKKFRKK